MPRDEWKNSRLPTNEQRLAQVEPDPYVPPSPTCAYIVRKTIDKISGWKTIPPLAVERAQDFFDGIEWGKMEPGVFEELLIGCGSNQEFIRELCKKTVARLLENKPPKGQKYCDYFGKLIE